MLFKLKEQCIAFYVLVSFVALGSFSVCTADQNAADPYKMAFSTDKRGSLSIRIVTEKGTTDFRMGSFSQFPSFSPDGKTLFYEGVFVMPGKYLEKNTETGEQQDLRLFQIFSIDLSKEESTPDMISNGLVHDSHPVCSPNGRKLAFVSRPNDQKTPWQVYIMDVTGRNRRPLVPGNKAPQFFPSWSPDNSKVVFVELVPDSDIHKLQTRPSVRLNIRDLERQTTSTILSSDHSNVKDPSWSPTGEKIVYSALDHESKKRSIWLINSDGTQRKKLTDGPDDRQPFWSPSGKGFAFVRVNEDPSGEERYSILFYTVETRKVHLLYQGEGGEEVENPVLWRPTIKVIQLS